MWPPYVDACPVSAKPVMPPSRFTRLTSSPSCHVLLLFRAPHESFVTPPWLLVSLCPSLLASILHRPWSISMNFSLDLHRIRRPPHCILCLHIMSQETSNSHNIVNYSSSDGDQHWSSPYICDHLELIFVTMKNYENRKKDTSDTDRQCNLYTFYLTNKYITRTFVLDAATRNSPHITRQDDG